MENILNDNNMKIDKNAVVAVSYELEVEGKIADKATEEKPLEYIQGMGMLLPKFEEALAGKQEGDGYEFTLTPEEGYGVHSDEYVISLPKSSFEIDGELREDLLVPGRVIPMYNAAGQVVQGTVTAVEEDAVKMDFNHPMAGKTLHFTGKVVSVREATEKELTEGLHGEFLPQEGCNCEGGCNGGCHKDGECHKDGGCGEKKGGCKKGGCHKKDA